MGTFDAYVNPSGDLEVVKRGFSWPGFFFGFIWAFLKKLKLIGSLLLVAFIVLRVLEAIAGGNNSFGGLIFIGLLNLGLALLVGFQGNHWRRKKLTAGGYTVKRAFETAKADEEKETLLEVKDLKKYFPIHGGIFGKTVGHVKAVDGVSFSILKGETLGLVGESGSGKSTTGRAILRLIEPTAGEVRFDGVDVLALDKEELRALRRRMQIIFQDPYASLNPRMTVGSIVGEPFAIHNIASGEERAGRVEALLKRVGLSPEHIRRYPHEFSGGQRQRIGVARALALNPDLIIGDEPVSALEQGEFGLSYLIIAHDLSVVRHICHRIAVMYLGKIVEIAENEKLYGDPLHPYTEALLSAVPVPDPTKKRERIVLTGDIPSPINPPSGCVFHTRCPIAEEQCKTEIPPLRTLPDGRLLACHLRGE
jgi:oligopeptide/dipeptide ABC transporter ATP-binding protein